MDGAYKFIELKFNTRIRNAIKIWGRRDNIHYLDISIKLTAGIKLECYTLKKNIYSDVISLNEQCSKIS